MAKQDKTYLRKDYINNYRLTEEEYHLLPLKYRMEYCYQLMGSLLSHLLDVGTQLTIDEEIADYVTEFFENNGCKVEHDTDSETNTKKTRITRQSNTIYPKSSSNEVRLNQHIYDLASAKTKIFEDILKERLQTQIKFLEIGVPLDIEGESPAELLERITTYSTLDSSLEESRDYIIHFQLKMLIMELESADVTIRKPSSNHIHYLKTFGYEVIEDDDTITIKQKTKDTDNKSDNMGLFKKFREKKGCKSTK